ncbi:hypothetical protein [Streptomyces sp. LN785]|uniref:hypothetical protein n=1 Tax=Streptomyces sp. LN785 TaxID=3112983 RepID=UPI00371A2050
MEPDFARYDALVMDWDGTLVDSQPLNFRSLAAALAPHGVALDQLWYREEVPGFDMGEELGEAPVLVIVGRVESLQNEWFEQRYQFVVRDAVDGLSGGQSPPVRQGEADKVAEQSRDVIGECREEVEGGALLPWSCSCGQRGFEEPGLSWAFW